MVALLEAIIEPDHYVYGLFLLNIDGSIDHCFYIGESDSPQDRLLGHRNEEMKKNRAKWQYFKKYDHARIRMIVLLKNTMGCCSVIEKLFIQNEDKFGNFRLTNLERGGEKITLKCDTIAGLRDILNLGISNNQGYNADSVQHSPAVKQRKSKARVVRSEERHTENISAKLEALPPFSNPNNPMSNGSSSAENIQLNIPPPTIEDEIRDSNVKKLKESYVFTGGKKQLVNDNTLLDPSTINGTFLNMVESEFDMIVHDNHSSLAFAARCQLIKNTQKCPNCKSRDMKVIGTDRTGRKVTLLWTISVFF
uniref:GIY-YIG domain-containing protein n=1 Tax=Panagrolaimus davidi TaxID=227884 RepID=A0A914NYJ7_9BILA